MKELDHLPEAKIKDLEEITRRIKDTGMAIMIILFGSHARGDWRDYVGGWSGAKSDYDIFVVTDDERNCQELEIRLQRMFEDSPTYVQCVVEPIGFVNMHIREGQYFFTEIKEQGIVLYKDQYVELAEREILPPGRKRELAELEYDNWFGTAEENLEVAKYMLKKFTKTGKMKPGKKAAFELQQTVENSYTAVEITYTRRNPCEHKLLSLRMNAARYAPEIKTCFPLKTEEERYLFWHLCRAYIGARYWSDKIYSVTLEQLEYWLEEAEKLLAVTEKSCQKYIAELREQERRAGD